MAYFNINTGQTLSDEDFIALVCGTTYTCCDYNSNVWINNNVAKTEYQWQNYFNANNMCSDGNVPVNTVAPAISGTLIVGQTLTSTSGTWTSDTGLIPPYLYQWKRGGVNISGATSSTYTLVQADAGQNITCQVTATDSDGSASATSNSVTIYASILDIVPNATGAYGFELLRGAYYGSPIVRIRRSGDNSESDFSVGTNGLLNTTAIQAFCIAGGGTQHGYVVTMYNQSGDATTGNAIQTTPLNQPQIVVSGVIVTENGKISSTYNGTTQLLTVSFTSTKTQPITYFAISKVTSTNGGILGSSTYANDLALCKVGTTTRAIATTSSISFAGSSTSLAYYYACFNGASSQLKLNNNTTATGNLGTIQLSNLRIGFNSNYGNIAGCFSRAIIYPSSQSANESTIRTNLNNYYGVY